MRQSILSTWLNTQKKNPAEKKRIRKGDKEFSSQTKQFIRLFLYLALLEIPLETIGKHGIVKFDLYFGPVLHNFSIDIG